MSTSSVVTANEIIDHYAFDQGRRPVGTPTSDRRPPPPQRQGSNRSGQSSHYDDSSSVNSIDYASTHKSNETKKSVERPRAGVLKTVGGSDEPEMPRDAGYDIPEINFGPTINYGATQQHNRTPSALTPGSNPAQRPYSPADQRPTPPAHKSSGSHGSQGSHGRKDSEDMKRTMAWQPGASAAPSTSQGLSAEQFVQQRAAHARSASSNTLSGGRPTTPGGSMKRTSSYDMLQGLQGGPGRHSRSSSAELLSRPGSRGANSALNFASSGDAPTHSAREQEQVARLTGAPLISVPGHQRQGSQGSAMLGHQRQASSGSGLVAAIEAREREKQQMKQGMSSQAVQHAINQRQQQQAAMAYQQQVSQQHQQQLAQQQMAQQQMAQQQMMQQQLAQQQQMAQQQAAYQQQAYQQQQMGGAYSTMGRGGGGGQYGAGGMPYGGPQQAGGYGQPASFSRPLRTPQQVDPRFAPPQGQYGPAPGSQQAPRNVHPQYQGQAF
ncbi:hypothetical protein NW754_013040 [Fusarium falciforme]|nr:hypothetical protein NW754_013040 [Fusarium falciforme]